MVRRGHGWAGLPSGVRTVRQAIALIAQAESVSELEIGASALRIPPHRRSVLGNGRGGDKDADDEERGSHQHSMTPSAGPVEPPQRRYD